MNFHFNMSGFDVSPCVCVCVWEQVLGSALELLTLLYRTVCWILVKVNNNNKSSEDEMIVRGMVRCSFSVNLNHFCLLRFVLHCSNRTSNKPSRRCGVNGFFAYKNITNNNQHRLELHFQRLSITWNFIRGHSFSTIFTI